MTPLSKMPFTILIADDDDEDRMLIQDALEECNFANVLRFAEDGEQVIDYLKNSGKFSEKKSNRLPDLILLDLNMPKKDGREVLAELKKDPRLKAIPVVALTTSNDPEDIKKMYGLGVNSYITKPVSFQALVDAMNGLKNYWFEIVTLPEAEK